MEKQVTQPMNMVFVRHGQSEANLVQYAEKNGEVHKNTAEIYARHDFEHPLTEKGVQQAKAARRILMREGIAPETFDEWYVSPFVRTTETAAYIGNGVIDWLPEIRLRERDWGIYGATPLSERIERFADTEKRREISSYYTRYDGGENIPDVIGRVRDWLTTLNREKTDKNILAVTHGELMWTVRYVLEGMAPSEWHDLDKDKTKRIGNCCILWYSRQNPDDPNDISPTVTGGWRRMIDPYEPEKSPYDGEWVKLGGRTRLMGGEILAAAERRVRMTDDSIVVPN
jgi:broad specificity phosphatase PhoE